MQKFIIGRINLKYPCLCSLPVYVDQFSVAIDEKGFVGRRVIDWFVDILNHLAAIDNGSDFLPGNDIIEQLKGGSIAAMDGMWNPRRIRINCLL